MPPQRTLTDPPGAEALGPILADLGVDPGRLAPLGSAGAPSHRSLAVAQGAHPASHVFDALSNELGPGGAFLLLVPGAPTEEVLAAWRNALWPLVHVVGLYRCAGERARRETLQGSETLAGPTPFTGVIQVGRRRSEVMAPDATVEKFDLNAAGWDGTPGGPGYPHFRWMRRYVGVFASAAPRARILDFGCGAGWVGIEAAKQAESPTLCFFDPSPEMVRIAESNAAREGIANYEGRTGFGEDPPFPRTGEEPFDLVISSGVVSFSLDIERWLDGLARAVKPSGTLVVGDIHLDSKGFRKRRRTKPLLPVRELNAQLPDHIKRGLEARGFRHTATAGYQLTWPIPQVMHLNETKLKGVLTWPLLGLNKLSTGVHRLLGSPAQSLFDSWVMRFEKEAGKNMTAGETASGLK